MPDPNATHITGRAAALRIPNLDTDQIMPKQFLRGIDKQGLAAGLLYDLRYDGQGNPRNDCVLNQPAYAGTSILLADANFGCGSSREHAVWGLLQYGIRAVIAPSYGEIFFGNAMNNRLLLVTLPQAQVEALMAATEAPDAGPITIDPAQQRVSMGALTASFELMPLHRRMFLEGVDLVGLSMTYRERIEAFAAAQAAGQPWLANVVTKTAPTLRAR